MRVETEMHLSLIPDLQSLILRSYRRDERPNPGAVFDAVDLDAAADVDAPWTDLADRRGDVGRGQPTGQDDWAAASQLGRTGPVGYHTRAAVGARHMRVDEQP